jgi:hypothetical protein
MKAWQPAMTSADRPKRLEGQSVSADYFRVLGIAPILGRDFTPADDPFQGPNNVILSDTLWCCSFSADPAVIGLILGLTAAILASRAIAAFLFDTSRFDALTYAAVTALLLLVSAAACLIPARRATAIDPVDALRAE